MAHNPTEHIQEEISHRAAHAGHTTQVHAPKPVIGWVSAAAVTAAFLAALAAVSGALATKHLTESTHERLKANDQWSYYQSKSLKNYLLDTKDELLVALGHERPEGDAQKIEQNNAEKKATKERAERLEAISVAQLQAHETYELAATMFHVAIAMVAVSVVAKRKLFWYLSLALGIAGISYLVYARVRSPAEEREPPAPPAAAAAPHAGNLTNGTVPAEHKH